MEQNVDNTPNLEQMMQLGISTARQGHKENARMIFRQVLDADKDNERAWLWMAQVAASREERVRYLQTVLRINPNNGTALKQLNQMKRKKESTNTQVIRYGILGLAVVFVLILFVVAAFALF